jgi:Tfp pilus assembly protein PilF
MATDPAGTYRSAFRFPRIAAVRTLCVLMAGLVAGACLAVPASNPSNSLARSGAKAAVRSDDRPPLERAVGLLGQQDYGAASALLEKVVERQPTNAAALCWLGIAYGRLGHMEKAGKTLERAAALEPTDPRPLEFLGNLHLERKDWLSARLAFDRANQRLSYSPRILTAMGVVEFRAGRTGPAKGFFEQALRADAEYPPALYNLAVLYRDRLRDSRNAAAYFEAYLPVAGGDPHAAVAHQFLKSLPPGIAAGGKGSAPELEERAGRGAEAWRTPPAVAEDEAETPRDGKPAGGRPEAGKEKSIALSYWNQGLACQNGGDLDGAIAYYKLAVQMDATLASAWYNMGLAQKTRGDTNLATVAFSRAVEIQPAMADAHYMLAVLDREGGRARDAMRRLERLVQKNPTYAKGHYLLGVLYYEANKPKPAREQFEGVMRMESTGPFAEKAAQWLKRMKQEGRP